MYLCVCYCVVVLFWLFRVGFCLCVCVCFVGVVFLFLFFWGARWRRMPNEILTLHLSVLPCKGTRVQDQY